MSNSLIKLLCSSAFLLPLVCFGSSNDDPKIEKAMEILKELRTDNIELSPFQIEGGQVRIEGYALNSKVVPTYLHSTEESKIGKVNLEEISPAERQGRRVIHFIISVEPPDLAPHELNTEQREVLDEWLKKRNSLRLAEVGDCDCDEGIQEMRNGQAVGVPVPDYTPYCAVGDFNGDDNVDFAVALVDINKKKNGISNYFVLVVFNGPFIGKDKSPAFVERDIDLTSQGIFFGFPYRKPYRLIVGPFSSEGSLLMPNKRSYKWLVSDY